jgi:hypothetical protein
MEERIEGKEKKRHRISWLNWVFIGSSPKVVLAPVMKVC